MGERDRALDPAQTRARDTLFKLATAWRSSAASGVGTSTHDQQSAPGLTPDACGPDNTLHLTESHPPRRARQPF